MGMFVFIKCFALKVGRCNDYSMFLVCYVGKHKSFTSLFIK